MTDRKKELIRSLKFTLFSISAGLIQMGSYALFIEVFHFVPWVSHLISLTLSVVWNFTLNRKYTFHSANNVPVAMLKVLGYYLVFTPLSTLWMLPLRDTGWIAYLAEFLTMFVNFVTEFLFQRFVVFKDSIDTAKK